MLPQEGELRIDPDEQLEREAEETAQRVMRGGEIGVHRMRKSDVHIQRTPSEVSVENNYSGIREIKEEVATLRQELNSLRDEVHSGWSAKMATVMGSGATAALTAGSRAMAEPALQDQFANSMSHPEVAIPAFAAGTISLGVAAGQETLKGAYGRAKERLFGADDTEQANREEKPRDEEEDSTLGIF